MPTNVEEADRKRVEDSIRAYLQGKQSLAWAVGIIRSSTFSGERLRAILDDLKQVLPVDEMQGQKELASKLRLVFCDLLITGLHEFAERAAEAAEAAGARGEFWEMRDFLYEHQDLLGNEDKILASVARLRLNAQKLAEEIAQYAYLNRIKEDFNGGVRRGINGTPTFYVNGTRYNGSPAANDLMKSLEE